MIDSELVTRKIALKSRDEYLGSARDQLAAERPIERIIGRMIDINYHLITETGHPPPSDYYESFVRLGTLQVLPPGFARRIAACAGLRNRLVHEYDEVDPAKVYEAVPAAAADIPEYLRRVHQYVEKTSAAG